MVSIVKSVRKFLRKRKLTITLIIKLGCLLTISFSLPSCKKFVQIGPPATQLVTNNVFSDNGAATSAQLAIYLQMFSNIQSYTITCNFGLLSDELTNYSTLVPSQQLYTNSMVASAAVSAYGPWSGAYNYIYQANAIISGLSEGIS